MEINSFTLLFVSVFSFRCVLSVTAVGSDRSAENSTLSTFEFVSTSAPNFTRTEFQEYSVNENVESDSNAAKVGNNENKHDTERKRESNSTTQIYIIAVIGVAPAAIGAFMWFCKNLKRKCVREKAASKRTNNVVHATSANPFLISDVPLDITFKIVQRAEKLNDSNAVWYNNYRPSSFVKSRRVYSLEVPRKNLDMIEVLGEGNFGQVYIYIYISSYL